MRHAGSCTYEAFNRGDWRERGIGRVGIGPDDGWNRHVVSASRVHCARRVDIRLGSVAVVTHAAGEIADGVFNTVITAAGGGLHAAER